MLRATFALILCLQPLGATIITLRGRVIMQDGSAAPAGVIIERVCTGAPPLRRAATDAKGLYFWHVADSDIPADMSNTQDLIHGGQLQESNWTLGVNPSYVPCRLRARLAGFESNSINLNDLGWTSNPDLPTLTLYRQGSQEFADLASVAAPASAEGFWTKSARAMQTKNWPEAEKQLRAAVQAAPKFAEGWNTLAMVCQTEKNVECERDAAHHVITADPKRVDARLRLLRLEMDQKQWSAAADAAAALLKADTTHQHPDAYNLQAVVRFQLKDLDGALASAAESVRLDPNHQFPASERIYGTLLEAKGDLPAAGAHLKKFLELDPKSPDATDVRQRLDNLGRAPAVSLAESADRELTPGGEAWVPGGLKAFAAIAHIESPVSYGNFFDLYCRAIDQETSVLNGGRRPKYAGSIQAYTASIAGLTQLGEQRGSATVVTVSPQNASRVLPFLGWRMVEQEGDMLVEPGDRPADALRQQIPAALGIDEIAMRDALLAGRAYSFEIPMEHARLMGGASWTALLKDLAGLPGGIAEAFARDFRMARAYAGLGAMGAETAAAAVKGAGLRNLVILYPHLLALYGDAFSVSQGAVAVPGGAPAEAVWAELAGASPRDPPAFLRKLLDKDHGALAAFYAALAHADTAHQRVFTANAKRAQFFYTWYRDSGELYLGQDRQVGTWRPAFFRNLPLDDAGHVRYPGGQAAWTTSRAADADALVEVKTLEALPALAQLERERHAPLDPATATLLARNFGEWNSLLPYFESLPGVGAPELEELAAFAESVSAQKPAARNSSIAEWHSLVELLVLGSRSGALDRSSAASFFRQACRELKTADHSAKAIALLRAMAGGDTNIEEAVPSRLLRLNAAQRADFERLKDLQRVPRLEAANASLALTGNVYAALLDPGNLLAAADPALLRRHRFIEEIPGKRLPLFCRSDIASISAANPEAYFSGGFGAFAGIARSMPRLGPAIDSAAASSAATAGPSASNSETAAGVEAVFRATARLVEVYATVTDDRGRYVDDLPSKAFTILENGKPVPSVAFETRASSVSLALLFDTTGSMHDALPSLKSAALKLIGELRPIDSVAVYSFSDTVNELQPFTSDKVAAERAVLRTEARGATALYDALVRINHELASRAGKKVIVVFTDGSDNLSVLTNEIAMQRARSSGIPIYTIAEGDALKSPTLLHQLSTVSKATGGVPFTISGPAEIRKVFETISQELMHGYLLAFQPPPVDGHTWRTVEVNLADTRNRKVRAREGYYPE